MTVHAPIQADFTYGALAGDPANDPAGLPLSVSIFADRGHLRDTMRDDARAAGFDIRDNANLASLIEGGTRVLGDIVMLDCPQPGIAALAALTRLDLRAARCGARLIVSTTAEGLDDIFGCMDQSAPQFLVDPSRADRVIALGQLLGRAGASRLRELSQDDRLVLLRLTEQVGQIAQRLDQLGPAMPAAEGGSQGSPDGTSAFHFESPSPAYRPGQDSTDRLVRAARPPLPDPRMVRRLIRQRQLRARFFDAELFADPAWDMLLDLTAARAEHTRVSVTSLCIASGVPPTTALRWIAQMTDAGLFQRVEDDTDRRRAFLALTDKAADGMARYFAELGGSGTQLI